MRKYKPQFFHLLFDKFIALLCHEIMEQLFIYAFYLKKRHKIDGSPIEFSVNNPHLNQD